MIKGPSLPEAQVLVHSMPVVSNELKEANEQNTRSLQSGDWYLSRYSEHSQRSPVINLYLALFGAVRLKTYMAAVLKRLARVTDTLIFKLNSILQKVDFPWSQI